MNSEYWEILEAYQDHCDHCIQCDGALMSDELCGVGAGLVAWMSEVRAGA